MCTTEVGNIQKLETMEYNPYLEASCAETLHTSSVIKSLV